MAFSEEYITQIIIEKIREVAFKKVGSGQEELIENRVLNSLTIVELALTLEKEFAISIPFIEINKENFKTVEAIRNLIIRKSA